MPNISFLKKNSILSHSKNAYLQKLVLDLINNKVNFNDLNFICFGAGSQTKAIQFLYPSIKIKYIVDNKKFSNKYQRKKVKIFHPSKLKNENPEKTIIINCTSDIDNVNKQLSEYGFKSKRHKLLASLLLFPPTLIRIYLPTDESFQKKFIELLKINRNNYFFTKVISHKQKSMIVGSLITNSEGFKNLEKINQKLYLLDSESDCNIAFDVVVKDLDSNVNVSNPFPKKLIDDIYFSNNYIMKNGLKIIDKKFTRLLNIYKSIYLSDIIFSEKPILSKNKKSFYVRIYRSEITDKRLNQIHRIINNSKYKLSIDQARFLEIHLRMQGINKSFLQDTLKNKNRNNDYELILFVIRESILTENLMNDFVKLLENRDLKHNKTTLFSENIKSKATSEIRSGNWFSSKSEKIAGPPVGIISFIDQNPNSNFKKTSEAYPYRTSKIYDLKSQIRSELTKLSDQKNTINFFHSPDDELEAYEYLDILDEPDKQMHLEFKTFIDSNKKEGK